MHPTQYRRKIKYKNPMIKAKPAVARIISQVISISDSHFYKVFRFDSIALVIIWLARVVTYVGKQIFLNTIKFVYSERKKYPLLNCRLLKCGSSPNLYQSYSLLKKLDKIIFLHKVVKLKPTFNGLVKLQFS